MGEKIKVDSLTFEEALAKLETIVDSMENGNIALDALISQFEEGDLLLKYCNKRLNQAELKIEKLKENSDNSFENFESFDTKDD